MPQTKHRKRANLARANKKTNSADTKWACKTLVCPHRDSDPKYKPPSKAALDRRCYVRTIQKTDPVEFNRLCEANNAYESSDEESSVSSAPTPAKQKKQQQANMDFDSSDDDDSSFGSTPRGKPAKPAASASKSTPKKNGSTASLPEHLRKFAKAGKFALCHYWLPFQHALLSPIVLSAVDSTVNWQYIESNVFGFYPLYAEKVKIEGGTKLADVLTIIHPEPFGPDITKCKAKPLNADMQAFRFYLPSITTPLLENQDLFYTKVAEKAKKNKEGEGFDGNTIDCHSVQATRVKSNEKFQQQSFVLRLPEKMSFNLNEFNLGEPDGMLKTNEQMITVKHTVTGEDGSTSTIPFHVGFAYWRVVIAGTEQKCEEADDKVMEKLRGAVGGLDLS